MPQQWGFLTLPRELRDIIYEYYVLEDGGYRFNYESGKLRAASGRLVDLAFMHTCILIATEMRGVALGSNTITFSTAYSDSERIKAGRFNLLTNHLNILRRTYIRWPSTCCPELQSFVTPSIDAELFRKYPQYVTARGLRDKVIPRFAPWGEAQSTRHVFFDDAFKLLSKETGFIETLANRVKPHLSAFVRSPFLYSTPRPWKIVSEDEVVEMDKLVPIFDRESYSGFNEYGDFWKRVYQRWSACAVAIHFLQSNSLSTRLQIKNVVLREDRPSVALPQCHAFGLIPFCLENPRLHIERRLDLWRTVLPSGPGPALNRIVNGAPENLQWQAPDYLMPLEIHDAFRIWMSEALALPKAGMPINSFSLVFDGDPIPERSSEIFECLKEGAAWEIALDQWSVKNSITVSLEEGV